MQNCWTTELSWINYCCNEAWQECNECVALLRCDGSPGVLRLRPSALARPGVSHVLLHNTPQVLYRAEVWTVSWPIKHMVTTDHQTFVCDTTGLRAFPQCLHFSEVLNLGFSYSTKIQWKKKGSAMNPSQILISITFGAPRMELNTIELTGTTCSVTDLGEACGGISNFSGPIVKLKLFL